MKKSRIFRHCEGKARSKPAFFFLGCFASLAMTVALLLKSCTEPIDIKTDNSPPVLVVYSVLTNEHKYQTVVLSRSSPYFDDTPNAGVSGAEVIIQSSEDERYTLDEHDSIKGLYHSQTKFGVRSGVTYSLSVEVDFHQTGTKEKYEASTTIQPEIALDSLTIEPIELMGHKNHILSIHWQDTPEDNYYLFHVTHNDSLLTSRISKLLFSDNAFFKGRYAKGTLYFFNDISEQENDPPEVQKRSSYLKPGDVITVQTALIPKGYLDFISQCQKEQRGENPMFGGPASNITTNISNGAAGYFVGYCNSGMSIEFTE